MPESINGIYALTRGTNAQVGRDIERLQRIQSSLNTLENMIRASIERNLPISSDVIELVNHALRQKDKDKTSTEFAGLAKMIADEWVLSKKEIA